MADKIRLNAYLSRTAFTSLKVKAAQANVTMTEYLETLLNPKKGKAAA